MEDPVDRREKEIDPTESQAVSLRVELMMEMDVGGIEIFVLFDGVSLGDCVAEFLDEESHHAVHVAIF